MNTRKGKWKVVSFYGSRWELYNMASDRFEQHDLAEQHPEIVQELSERWHALAESTDLLEEKDRKPVKEQRASNAHREWHKPQRTSGWEAPD